MKRVCPRCGLICDISGCNRCPPPRWGKGGTRAWRRQRQRILARDGYRCTAVIDGVRCPRMAAEVHHLDAGSAVLVADDRLASVCTAHNPRGG